MKRIAAVISIWWLGIAGGAQAAVTIETVPEEQVRSEDSVYMEVHPKERPSEHNNDVLEGMQIWVTPNVPGYPPVKPWYPPIQTGPTPVPPVWPAPPTKPVLPVPRPPGPITPLPEPITPPPRPVTPLPGPAVPPPVPVQ